MINIPLFVSQLNQIEETNLDKVCDLLRVHTSASVYVENHDGRIIAECLSETENKFIFKTGFITLKRGNHFSDDEKLAANIALLICTMLIRHREEVLLSEKKRRTSSVRTIINSLSFSELEAAKHMLKTLCEKNDNQEGLLIAGHIADKLGFTRSVVTGALRKLEGANLIETRSLGMKGTYIRVKDTLLLEELRKL